MLVVKLVVGVVAVLGVGVLALAGLVLLGQVASNGTAMLLIFLALMILAAAASWRISTRWDEWMKGRHTDTMTWGRVRDQREPGLEEERMTK